MSRRRILGLAAATSLQALLLAGPAFAQGVQIGGVRIFEEAPPLELLRSIMIPESRPGASRRIVLNAPTMPAANEVQQIVSPAEPAPAQPVARPRPERGPATAAARIPAPASDAGPALNPLPARPAAAAARASAPETASAAEAVGFRINFALNSAVVPQSALVFVERIAELMREQPELRLQVEGHTDALGSDAYNLDLSRRRAMAVATYLVEQQGVEAERLVVVGFGEQAPLTENAFDPRNRRVQFTRVD